MSIKAMNWVYYDAQIPEKTAKGEPNAGVLTAVLLCMADGYGDETGLAFRSVLNIAAMTRFDERTVRKAMRALESYGLIRESVDQSIVAAKVKRGDRRPTATSFCSTGRAMRCRTGGRATPSLQMPRSNGGASGPLVGTGGRAARDGGRAARDGGASGPPIPRGTQE
ncbi:hypothetical protein GS502_10760 [Rhodococcus hoagii]|nr:hypothetical protein [Prescottella equi]